MRTDRGNLITDFWGAYDTLAQSDHSRCNVHLLRELTSFSEDGHRWAEGLIAALLAIKQAADDARQRGQKQITPATRKHGLNLMDSIKSALAGQPLDFAPE